MDNQFSGGRATIARFAHNPILETTLHDVTLPICVEVDGFSIWPARCSIDPEVHPQLRDHDGRVIVAGAGCDREAKRCAEALFFDCGRHDGTSVRVARIFTLLALRKVTGKWCRTS